VRYVQNNTFAVSNPRTAVIDVRQTSTNNRIRYYY